jgi:hypothetical protein
MVDSLERKETGAGLMPKKKANSIPPKLTEAEQDPLTHMERAMSLRLILSVAIQSCAA